MTVASADYVESFCSAAEMVLTQLLGDSPVRGDLVDLSAPVFPLQQMNIGVGITGDVRGQVNFGFERSTGLSIAGAMMYEEIADFSEMSLSALSELSNMISGNATIGISAAGIKCDITPPHHPHGGQRAGFVVRYAIGHGAPPVAMWRRARHGRYPARLASQRFLRLECRAKRAAPFTSGSSGVTGRFTFGEEFGCDVLAHGSGGPAW